MTLVRRPSKNRGGGEEIAGADLAHVGLHRRRALGAVHAEAGPVGLAHGEDEVADPGHGQVGEDVLGLGQTIEGAARLGGGEDVAVGEHHALGLAGGAGGVEHDADVFGGLGRDAGADVGMDGLGGGAAGGLDLGIGVKMAVVVAAQAARIEVDHPLQGVQAALDLEHLVDLLLVAGDDEAGAAVVEDESHLLGHGVLVERHGDGAAALGGGHRPVERGAVAADDGDVVAGLQAEGVEAGGEVEDLTLGLGPGPDLPDAEFLLATGGTVAEAPGVAGEELRKRVEFGGSAVGRHHVILPAAPLVGALPMFSRVVRHFSNNPSRLNRKN